MLTKKGRNLTSPWEVSLLTREIWFFSARYYCQPGRCDFFLRDVASNPRDMIFFWEIALPTREMRFFSARCHCYCERNQAKPRRYDFFQGGSISGSGDKARKPGGDIPNAGDKAYIGTRIHWLSEFQVFLNLCWRIKSLNLYWTSKKNQSAMEKSWILYRVRAPPGTYQRDGSYGSTTKMLTTFTAWSTL